MSDPMIAALRASCPTCETSFTYARLGLARVHVGQVSTVGCPVCRATFDTVVEEVQMPVWNPIWPERSFATSPVDLPNTESSPLTEPLKPLPGRVLFGYRMLPETDVQALHSRVDAMRTTVARAYRVAASASAERAEALAVVANAQQVQFIPTLTARSIRRP